MIEKVDDVQISSGSSHVSLWWASVTCL